MNERNIRNRATQVACPMGKPADLEQEGATAGGGQRTIIAVPCLGVVTSKTIVQTVCCLLFRDRALPPRVVAISWHTETRKKSGLLETPTAQGQFEHGSRATVEVHHTRALP